MELKAKMNFTDKYNTKKEYKKNDIIKVDEKRGKEMLKSPYNIVEEIKKEIKKESKKDVQAKSDKEFEN